MEVLRERFPLIGVFSIDEPDLAERFREVQASARQNREIVEAIESVRRTA